MRHLPEETQRRLTKMTLDRLLDCAINYHRAENDRERYRTDETAYNLLCFYAKDIQGRFITNYRRLKDEVKS